MTQRSTWGKRHGWVLLAMLTAAPAAWAGGTPEDVLLLIDPTRPDAMYVGNYYLHARDIPPVNVLYMDPMAVDYWTFAEDNLDALFGTLANTGVRAQIDYVVIAPGSGYRVYAAGLVSDLCSPVNHFSLSSVYTLWYPVEYILGGNMTHRRSNRYFGEDNAPLAFDSNILWKDGVPSGDGTGQKYFIGAYLGYTGERGNTVNEIIDMIDRGVAADGTRPAGTLYYMETTDEFRSPPRHGYFPTAVADITELGGSAEHLLAVLPTGRHDCLGIMTGWASPDIDGTDMTILPGAICDHLTSYAGHFGSSSQVKMSRPGSPTGPAGRGVPWRSRATTPASSRTPASTFTTTRGYRWVSRFSAAWSTCRSRVCSTATRWRGRSRTCRTSRFPTHRPAPFPERSCSRRVPPRRTPRHRSRRLTC